MLKQFARSVDFIDDDSYAPNVDLLVIALWFLLDLGCHVVLAAAVGLGFVGFEVDDAYHAKIDVCCFDFVLVLDVV